jgi:hypothetical protein
VDEYTTLPTLAAASMMGAGAAPLAPRGLSMGSVCPKCHYEYNYKGICPGCGGEKPPDRPPPRLLRPLVRFAGPLIWAALLLPTVIYGTLCIVQEGVHWGDTSREPTGSVEECREIGNLMGSYCYECSTYGRVCADCNDWACIYCEKCTSKPYDECMKWCW